MDNTSIKQAYSTIESCFKDMLSEVTDLVEKEFESLSEMNEWFDKQWKDYGSDIIAYLEGCAPHATDEDQLMRQTTLTDMAEAIKANSESIFGFDISSYLEQ